MKPSSISVCDRHTEKVTTVTLAHGERVLKEMEDTMIPGVIVVRDAIEDF